MRLLPAVVLPLALLGAAPAPLDADFEIRDCLTADRDALEEALEAIRTAHRGEIEERGFKRAWRRLDRRLKRSSDDARTLVGAWLDDRPRARRLYFCDDGLPLPQRDVEPAGYTDAAIGHLDASWTAEERWLRGADADREAAASRLDAIRVAVLHRFDALFDNRADDVVVARVAFADRLDAWHAARIEPWQLGRDANGTLVMFELDPEDVAVPKPDPTEIFPIVGSIVMWVRAITPQPPDMSPPEPFADLDYDPGPRHPLIPSEGLQRGDVRPTASSIGQIDPIDGTPQIVNASGEILDPKDAVELTRILESWRRQRQVVEQALREERRTLRDVRRRLRRDDLTQDELDRLARDAERSRRRLSRLSEDATRLMNRVQDPQASRPWIEDVLRGRLKRDEIEALGADDEASVVAWREAEALVEEAVARGADVPGTGDGGGAGAGGRGLAGAASEEAGEGAPGAAVEDGGAPLSQPVEGTPSSDLLAWEGPLPVPDPAWSDDLVDAIRSAHPKLDPTDVRILLGLIRNASGVDRPTVEASVRASIDRLGLRGGEETLSDLYDPSLSPDQQVEIVFVLEWDLGN